MLTQQDIIALREALDLVLRTHGMKVAAVAIQLDAKLQAMQAQPEPEQGDAAA